MFDVKVQYKFLDGRVLINEEKIKTEMNQVLMVLLGNFQSNLIHEKEPKLGTLLQLHTLFRRYTFGIRVPKISPMFVQ